MFHLVYGRLSTERRDPLGSNDRWQSVLILPRRAERVQFRMFKQLFAVCTT
jgi:hypothetical protein